METIKKLKSVLSVYSILLVGFMLVGTESFAATAETSCTKKCTFCVTVNKKRICSESYMEDSDEFEKARQLKKFVNEGLINPDETLKNGFSLDNFNQKYFNCELMIRKAEQIQEAAQKMCVAKTVRYEKTTFQKRVPASSPAPVKAKPKRTKYSN